MAAREIGSRPGTGGSRGVEYLRGDGRPALLRGAVGGPGRALAPRWPITRGERALPGLSHAATLDRLRGLLDVAAAVRTGDELPAVLASVAAAIAGPLGYGAVVINLYRPAWDDFEVVVVLGNEESQRAADGPDLAAGGLGPAARAALPPPRRLLRPRRRVRLEPATACAPTRPTSRSSTTRTRWHPDDALMVPLRSASGEVLGIVVGRRAGHRPPARPGRARAAQRRRRARRDRASSRPRAPPRAAATAPPSSTSCACPPSSRGATRREEMLDAVCDGIREALGFQKVMVFLADHPGGHLVPLSGVGFTAEQVAGFPPFPLDVLPPLLDAAFLRHGCVVMDARRGHAPHAARHPRHLLRRSTTAAGRAPGTTTGSSCRCTTATAGSPAWSGSTTPRTACCPRDGELQALRAFANQAMSAIESARQLDSLRHLAAHDPLTGLRNRRGFEPGIDAHLDALGPAGELSLLVLDLDHFKRVNDSLGHDAGDDVLRRFADVLRDRRRRRRRADAARRRGVRARAPRRRRGAGAGRRRAPAAARAQPVRDLPAPGLRLRRRRQPRPRGARRRRAHARRQPRAVRRQAARPRPLRRPPRADARDARRAARRRGRRRRAARRRDAAGRDARPARRRHRAPLRDGRPLRRADRRASSARAARVERDPRRRDPPRHRQARDRGRDPAQAGPLDAARVGGDASAIPRSAARILEHANLRDIGGWVLAHHERIDGGGYPQGLRRRARSRSRRASSRSPTPTRR